MKVTSGVITWAGVVSTRPDRRTGGDIYYQDFICRFNDNVSGKVWTMKFTVVNDMRIVGKLEKDLLVSFEFIVEANEWLGKYYNNPRILRGTMHCVGRKGA